MLSLAIWTGPAHSDSCWSGRGAWLKARKCGRVGISFTSNRGGWRSTKANQFDVPIVHEIILSTTLVIFFMCVVRHALPLRWKLVRPKPHHPYRVRLVWWSTASQDFNGGLAYITLGPPIQIKCRPSSWNCRLPPPPPHTHNHTQKNENEVLSKSEYVIQGRYN